MDIYEYSFGVYSIDMYDRLYFKIWFITIYEKLSPWSITVTVTHFSFFGSWITLPDFLAQSRKGLIQIRF